MFVQASAVNRQASKSAGGDAGDFFEGCCLGRTRINDTVGIEDEYPIANLQSHIQDRAGSSQIGIRSQLLDNSVET